MANPGALWAMAVLVGMAVDRCWGEPSARWHPVVWMGKALELLGRWAAPLAGAEPAHAKARPVLRGCVAWWLMALLVVALAVALERAWLQGPGWLAVVGLGLCFKPMMAWRMLHDEVAEVGLALDRSLDAGRERLSWLCSRPVAGLDETQVRETAIETLAENLNDSVVAPVVWFLVAGLPGAVLYRMANTADAMWGYRGERQGRVWSQAGMWAARADDVLSWVPARLTAVLLALADWAVAAERRNGTGWWLKLRSQARLTPSPNGGWPMAAMALALQVRLGKPGVYMLNEGGRAPEQDDLVRALRLARVAVWVLVLLLTSIVAFGAIEALAAWSPQGGAA